MKVEEIKHVVVTQREWMEDVFERERIIGRDVNMDQLGKFIEHPNILAILGVRRCGKTFFTWLLLKNKKYGYINFFDERLNDFNAGDFDKLLQAFYELYGDIEYIILDEIQNIFGWERFVSRLRTSKKVIITGSNSQLLSGELATSLTGRYVDFQLFPFNFREHLILSDVSLPNDWMYSTRRVATVKKELENYIRFGGFPEVHKFGEKMLQNIYYDIIEKDVMGRYRIRHTHALRDLARYLISNFSKEVTFNKLKNIIRVKDLHTVSRYVEYFRNAYLILVIERFSFKLKEQILAPRKVYCMDTGLINVLSFKTSENKGRLMENLVLVELLRRKSYHFRDWEIYYWKDHQGREVDFIIKEGTRVKELIQVTYASGRDEIERREIKALEKAGEEMKCKNKTVITWDYEDEGEIKFIPLWKWLLEENKNIVDVF